MNEGADLKTGGRREVAGVGRVLIWQGGALWIGHDAGSVQTHAHHAIQVALALSGSVRLREPGGAWADFAAAIVRPHRAHQFDGSGGSVAHVFVEPETVQGRALLAGLGEASIVGLGDALHEDAHSLREAYARKASDAQLERLASAAVLRLSGEQAAPAADARITRTIEWVRGHLKEPLTLAQAAQIAHLSPGRFRHLFVAQTGISFRAYLLWARVNNAVGEAMAGTSWTEAAQAWGFADSAHLSRTCRRMFGIAPSMLRREGG